MEEMVKRIPEGLVIRCVTANVTPTFCFGDPNLGQVFALARRWHAHGMSISTSRSDGSSVSGEHSDSEEELSFHTTSEESSGSGESVDAVVDQEIAALPVNSEDEEEAAQFAAEQAPLACMSTYNIYSCRLWCFV